MDAKRNRVLAEIIEELFSGDRFNLFFTIQSTLQLKQDIKTVFDELKKINDIYRRDCLSADDLASLGLDPNQNLELRDFKSFAL